MMTPADPASPEIVLVTGMSGAGRTATLKALEDMGFEAVDNVPLSLIPNLVGGTDATQTPIAVCADVRTRDFDAEGLIHRIDDLAASSARRVRVVFLDCDNETLLRRFEETRHRHPLAGERPIADGIRIERERIGALRERADLVIDTTDLTLGALKRTLAGHFSHKDSRGLALFVTSFSYRRGLPRDADLVFDVRFLRNPHYEESLRAASGRAGPVGTFIAEDPGFQPFFDSLTGLLAGLLPRYAAEGKSYLTIAFGCTGGRHRSVYIAERMADWLEASGATDDRLAVHLIHRDLEET